MSLVWYIQYTVKTYCLGAWVQAKCRPAAATAVPRVQEKWYVHCIVAEVLGAGVRRQTSWAVTFTDNQVQWHTKEKGSQVFYRHVCLLVCQLSSLPYGAIFYKLYPISMLNKGELKQSFCNRMPFL